jgi:glycerophosphoryl diester phosphodiesterase
MLPGRSTQPLPRTDLENGTHIDDIRANRRDEAPAPRTGPSIAGLPRPFFVAHRGGAGIAPENSMDAYLQAVALGADGIEAGDLQLLSDGGLGAMHDATVDRTTTGTGAPSTYSTAGWRDLVLDASTWFGSGWPDLGPPPTFAEILSRLGGRTVLVPEVKDLSHLTAATLCAAVGAAGLTDSVLIQCFDLDTCRAIAAAGCHTIHLMRSGVEHPPSTIRAAGIEWVAVLTTVAPSVVRALKAEGLGVLVFTDDDQKQVDAWWATGDIDGFFTDQPAYAAGRFNGYRYRTASAPWVSGGRRSHGMNDVYSNTYTPLRAAIVGPPGAHRFQPAADHRSAVLQGWACPLVQAAGTYTITVPITFDTLDADPTSWSGCYFGMADDTTGAQDAHVTGPRGWLAVLQQDGRMDLLKGDGSTYRSQATTGSAPVSAGETVDLVIEVTPSSITVSRQDSASTRRSPSPAGGVGMHLADATQRGAYFHLRNRTRSGAGLYSWGAVRVS